MNVFDGLRDRNLITKITPESLLFYYGNMHSQCGQDGILAEIFRRLSPSLLATPAFVEFGAWDGVHLSNSRFLFEKGWNGVFIEANQSKFERLQNRYRVEPGITCIHAMVGAPSQGVSGHRLVNLLIDHGVDPNSIAFVSIDVDGVDLEIFCDMGFTPPVVLLEGGFNFSPSIKQKAPLALNMQHPLGQVTATADNAGYVPVCFCQDTYLVRKDLAQGFMKIDTISLYRDAFFFMTPNYRDRLMALRQNSKGIRDFETEVLGRFSPNPLQGTGT